MRFTHSNTLCNEDMTQYRLCLRLSSTEVRSPSQFNNLIVLEARSL